MIDSLYNKNMDAFMKFFNRIGYSKWYSVIISLFVLNVSTYILFSTGVFGRIRMFTHFSDSMLPTINNGSITVVQKQRSSSYDTGDIITFYSLINGKEDIVTHRVYKVGGNVYLTKGDNNNAIDKEPVIPRLIIGKVILIIPYIGYWITILKTIPGAFAFIIIPGIVIVYSELANIFFLTSTIKPTSRKKHKN